MDNFGMSSGHVRERLLREPAEQHGITLTTVLQPCNAYFFVKRMRSGFLPRTTSSAGRPVETTHIDLASPCRASIGGLKYLLMLGHSASLWMRPYRNGRKSETTEYIQTFLADTKAIGGSLCFRVDNGEQSTCRSFADHCDAVEILRECTAPGKKRQNRGYQDPDLERNQGWPCDLAARLGVPSRSLTSSASAKSDPTATVCCWKRFFVWTADSINLFVTKTNTQWVSPSEVFLSYLPDLQVPSFFQQAIMRMGHSAKSDVQSVPLYYINEG